MSLAQKIGFFFLSLVFFAACTSSQIRARKEQREKVSQSSHLYCQFINGENYPDVDVEMNLEIAKRCDSDKPLTISSYHSPSDAIGMIYCCGMKENAPPRPKAAPAPVPSAESVKPAPAPEPATSEIPPAPELPKTEKN